VIDPGFCKKHERDKYYLEEQEKGIRYCDIARGCFKLRLEGYASCQECLDKTRILDSARYQKRKEIIKGIQLIAANSLCTYCGKDFEPFKTKFNKDSVSCTTCSENQSKQDEKRKDRIRNFKNEAFRNIKRYYKDYIKSASKRGFDILIDFDKFSEIVKAPCYYCGHHVENETNGIDRVDNAIGYTAENCVTACWKCNKMKHAYHQSFFLQKCHIMNNITLATNTFFDKWKIYYYRSCFKNFTAYKLEAEERNLIFNLTEDQWTRLTRSKCYLCGYSSEKGIGIDREDNTDRTYTFNNCRPCCGSCNDMKGEMSLDEFKGHCKTIADKWATPPDIVPEDPLKDVIANSGLTRTDDRKHWKGLGLYYAILAGTAQSFVDTFSDVYTYTEFNEMCDLIKESEKTCAIDKLKTLIKALKKRRSRLSIKE